MSETVATTNENETEEVVTDAENRNTAQELFLIGGVGLLAGVAIAAAPNLYRAAKAKIEQIREKKNEE